MPDIGVGTCTILGYLGFGILSYSYYEVLVWRFRIFLSFYSFLLNLIELQALSAARLAYIITVTKKLRPQI